MGRHHAPSPGRQKADSASTDTDPNAQLDAAAAHGHSHGHGHGSVDDRPWRERIHPRNLDPRRVTWTLPLAILFIALVVGFLITSVAVVLQWPHGEVTTEDSFHQTSNLSQDVVSGTVILETTGSCNSQYIGRSFDTSPPAEHPSAQPAPGSDNDSATCDQVIVEITSGEEEGRRTLLAVTDAEGSPELPVGEEILLTAGTAEDGSYTYAFQDYERSTPVWVWLAITLVAIIAVGAWRGVRAIAGLVITLGVFGIFLLPALARGGDPVLLAVTACSAVLYLVLFLVHGMNWKTASSLGGTLAALAVGTGLAWLAIDTNQLRGLADENNMQIMLYLPELSISGLLLAGFIIGTLGVLNDVTVAQASTISELREAAPGASNLKLFTTAMRVGRDHLASTVYTLVLSYAGAALPLLVLLSVSGRSFGNIFASDIMATEVLRSATGSLALVAAVPLTTAIAALTTSAVWRQRS
ncbi:MAG TPA: YibE/F family protein [Candidatus Corynebacterium avicola]|uniref:YibE/F family protein n=1 Tax=Candidatus Corynebacterium avicola TaxID=2838527 RepID=A0A9D1RSC7_9CORY|nr:YibE/F family protein [Candidatus Corynebacterium avicola]